MVCHLGLLPLKRTPSTERPAPPPRCCQGATAKAARGFGSAFTAPICSFVSQPGRARAGSFGRGSVHVSPFGLVHFGFGGSVGAGFAVMSFGLGIPVAPPLAPSHARHHAAS